MASDLVIINNINCLISFITFSDRLIGKLQWSPINHCELFKVLKKDFCRQDGVVYFIIKEKCYVIFWGYSYVLEIKEYELFINKYCSKESIVDWREDGF